MSDSYPTSLQYTRSAASTRIYFLLGVFVFIMIVIFKIFFKEEIRRLILGDMYKTQDESAIEKKIKRDGTKEVYNVGKNVYTYDDAKHICNTLNGKLATYNQVRDAYDNGAEWCNYGWTTGQNALFPVQKDTWENIQTRPEPYRYECGHKYGINGGFFENNELRLGANCYGVKPKGSVGRNYEISSYNIGNGVDKSLNQEEIDQLGIIPFNKDKWSKYS